MSLHGKGKTEEALHLFLQLKDKDPDILARDDKGLLDAAEILFTKRVNDTNDEQSRLELARLLFLRGRLAQSRDHFEYLSKNSKNENVVKESKQTTAKIDIELKQIARFKPVVMRRKRSKEREREIEELERQVDDLTEQNNKLKRAINEAHKNAISAQFAARKMRRLIEERKEEYRQYREDYQLFYRNLK